jgi:four helix bundle protein
MERAELEDRTATFAAEVCTLAEQVRQRPGGRRPADQLLDCATSVGANYRASARARSRNEFIAKLGLVAEEADESVYWLEFFWRVGLGHPDHVERLLGEARELRAIFAASCRTARGNHRGRNRRHAGKGRRSEYRS